jgi:general secretion pathway protein L
MMMNSLRILIAQSWPRPLHAHWVLLNEAQTPVRSGFSQPSGWPVTPYCDIVLGAGQMTVHELSLPQRARRRDWPRLFAYALEERLLTPADAQHLTPLYYQAGQAQLAVIARERLRAVLRDLASFDRRPQAAYAQQQCLAITQASPWTLHLGDDMHLLHAGESGLLSIDPAADETGAPAIALPPLLPLLIARAQPVPTQISVSPSINRPAPDLSAWQRALADDLPAGSNVPSLRLIEPWRWFALSPQATNILHDEFAPRHADTRWRARLQPLFRFAAIVFLAQTLLTLGDIVWHQRELAALRKQEALVFQQTMPPNTPGVQHLPQLLRHLDDRRAQAGQLRRDDFLAALAQIAEAIAHRDAIQSLHYADATLTVVLTPAAANRLPAVVEKLSAQADGQVRTLSDNTLVWRPGPIQ